MTAIASGFQFVSPISTSMIAPALSAIGEDLQIANPFERSMALSAFVLAYAIGSLLSAPLSEVFGRCYILQVSNLIFFAFNLACGFARTGTQLIVCRFFAGAGGR
jgi:MFS family permease